MEKYKLTITKRQAELIMKVLDLFTRISAGQLQELKIISETASEETLTKLQKEMFPELIGLNNSFGIHSPKLDDSIREIYDIFKVMMYEFHKDNGVMDVYADKVRQSSKKELPKFKKMEGE